jgi:hypothetical protein
MERKPSKELAETFWLIAALKGAVYKLLTHLIPQATINWQPLPDTNCHSRLIKNSLKYNPGMMLPNIL